MTTSPTVRQRSKEFSRSEGSPPPFAPKRQIFVSSAQTGHAFIRKEPTSTLNPKEPPFKSRSGIDENDKHVDVTAFRDDDLTLLALKAKLKCANKKLKNISDAIQTNTEDLAAHNEAQGKKSDQGRKSGAKRSLLRSLEGVVRGISVKVTAILSPIRNLIWSEKGGSTADATALNKKSGEPGRQRSYSDVVKAVQLDLANRDNLLKLYNKVEELEIAVKKREKFLTEEYNRLLGTV
ncbi:MAG: hypothetical protein AAFN76_12705 [Pseudomonadota bacterium]